LRSFDSAVEEGYRRLFPGEPDKAPDLLEWRFRDNPHGPAKFAAATEAGDPVGMIALVPTRLVNSRGEQGYQAIDTAVHPSQRGKGLFVKMGNAVQAELDGDVLWGFPYAAPLQAGQPVTVTSSCNATSTWLAASTNQPAPPPAQRGERGK
jgi:GNAT superfamily N-acetyltransferase